MAATGEAPGAGPPLSRARRAGDLLFISGQLPRGADGAIVRGDFRTKADRALANLVAILHAEGLGPEHVVKTTAWLTDAAHMDAFNAAYRAVFSAPYPARSVVISGLVADDADVEIEAVAHFG
ncbi:RidA family protein [Sphingosinicella sp. LY1275]|uniref:RidA family protein n=1 Tax=Sphingosinicella sp. LY1275 TaxID=3095379 RepID=UPI002ADED5EC|nr:RidA family protein [Sphingosinicella sp. LY1275]MEA1013936.1 RidA family protein [Sphingosinicella sp. LY1275]